MEEETDKDRSNKEQEEWLKIANFILLHYRLVPPSSLVPAFLHGESLGMRLPPNTHTPFYCL